MRKTHFTAQEENDISLIMEETGISRKSAIRKLQRRARLAAKQVKAPKVPSRQSNPNRLLMPARRGVRVSDSTN